MAVQTISIGNGSTTEPSAALGSKIVNGHVNGHANASSKKTIPVMPLTPEAFAPYGQVIQAYGNHTSAPKVIKITSNNTGTVTKFHKLAPLHQSYPETMGASSGLSVCRCSPITVLNRRVELRMLERHPYTNQGFIPMGGNEPPQDKGAYLVVVALNGFDDKPDLSTLRAFIANTAQGIMYDTAVWHQPLTVLQPIDFACVETQIGNGDKTDCEVLDMEDTIELQLP